MKIRTLKDMGFDGRHTPAGTIVECPNTLASELINSGRAVEVDADQPAEVETETEGPKPFLDNEDKPEQKPKHKGKNK